MRRSKPSPIIKGTLPGPRNPLVAASLFRKAGTHAKNTKALRVMLKQQTRKALNET